MRKINIKDIAEESWTSPKEKFGGASGREESASVIEILVGHRNWRSVQFGMLLRTFDQGVPLCPGETALTGDSEKSRSRSLGDKQS
jgi:hypothetical protein